MEMGRVLIFAAFFISCFLPKPCACAGLEIDLQGQDTANSPLRVGFYKDTCPEAELIASKVVLSAFLNDPTLAAGVLRLFFHDCFVNGCDASILLDTTPSGEPVEKTSPFNGNSLRGLELMDDIKASLEQACPGVVSCADILAFATRDAATFSGSKIRDVESGRRDGLSSRAAAVPGNLPIPTMTVEQMMEIFTKKNMTIEDLVVLTGAHSIGKAHCGMFDYRLYNYSGTEARDPKLNVPFALYLQTLCPPTKFRKWFSGNDRQVSFDTVSPYRLDNSFFRRLIDRKALLQSDQGLAHHPNTSALVQKMAYEPREWTKRFARAMVQLGRMEVLTGQQGEIRKNCRAVN